MTYAIPDGSKWRLFPSGGVWVTQYQPPGRAWIVGPMHKDRAYALAFARRMGCDLKSIEVLAKDPAEVKA